MHILLISETYDQRVGGVETQMQLVARELARTNRVEIATLSSGSGDYVDGTVPVHSLKLSLFDRGRLRLPRLVPRPCQRAKSWLFYRAYRSVYVPMLRPLVRGKDVVHTLNTSYLSWMAQEAARAEGVPLVTTPYLHPDKNGQVSEKQRALFCGHADIVFALLETDREILIRLGVPEERIHLAGVVPLLPERSDAQGFRTRYGLGDKPVVLFVGRVAKHKGPHTILEAARYVWRGMPDVHFVFAGPAREDARRWFSERQDERIRYLGLIDEQEKGDALAACDLFCMPSTAEILPAVYLEAWSYGKAVIGGTAHGLCELIEGHGAGITVKQDPELLARRLLELLRDAPRRRRMGECGRELVERRFSKKALIRALEGAYEAVRRPNASGSMGTRGDGRAQATGSSPPLVDISLMSRSSSSTERG